MGLGISPHELDRTVYNLLMERGRDIRSLIQHTATPGLDLLPANIDLSAAEVQLVGEVARESVLSRTLRPVLDDYDVVMIDCQPSLGLLTVNALTAAHGVLIPLECEFFALRGVALLVETIEKVRDRLNPRLEVDGILATMYDPRTLHAREVVRAWWTLRRHAAAHRHQPHGEVPRRDRGRRADHHLRPDALRCGGLPSAGT